MQTHTIPRRQFFRLVGAAALLGPVGTGSASASTGRYIVGTRSPAARREAQRQARSVHRTLDFGVYGSAVAGTFSEQALRGLARRPDVDYVEEDGLMYAIGIDPSATGELANSWGVDRIDAEKIAATGTGAKIAILDTGIDYTHPDLKGNYVGGVDYVQDDADPMDDNGHGTHCAGIAAASGGDGGVVGVAPGGSLYGVKVLSATGSGSYSDIAAGLNWARDNGMHVASMSLGGGRGTTTLERACNSARDAGVFVVAAAGNDGRGRLSYPAKYDSVVAVSATDKRDTLPSWSNTGDGMDHGAPGVEITSAVPAGLDIDGTFTMDNGGTYATWSGTSMACPHVAGVAALVMAADGLSGTDARARLAATAEDLGAAGWDKEYGYGLVDAEAAVGGGSGGDDTGDTTAPSAPTDLTATVTGESTVDLSWSASTDDTGVDHYDVSVDGAWNHQTTTTSTTVSGLAAGTTYTFGVTATDAAGNESSAATVQATTDSASGGGDTTSPTGDVAFERELESPNPHAEFELSWSASDSGGLESAEFVLTDEDPVAGGVEESIAVDLTGQTSASGTVSLRAHKDDGSGHPYTVTMTITDAAGNTASVSTPSFNETE